MALCTGTPRSTTCSQASSSRKAVRSPRTTTSANGRPRPAASRRGQTATIGFWQNNKGQSLIKALNGGASATQLGHWLADTFPNMYAALDGMTNAGVAGFYKTLFARNGQSSPGGPPKTDAQVMATALAVYVTNQTLAGNTAAAYGFQVTATGVGTRTFNVGNRGAAFGVANNTSLSVMDLLWPSMPARIMACFTT